MLQPHPYHVIFYQAGTQTSATTVCISLYNYQDYILETLESVYSQTYDILDLIIIEDQSPDESLIICHQWLAQHKARFNRVYLIQHQNNYGLHAARNTAVSLATTEYVFILDADNILFPRCVERCIESLNADPEASVAYPIIEKFGEEQGLMGNIVWNKTRFKQENYIDAMSLIRRQDLVMVGGYSELSVMGWEDYELWCKFFDQGLYGVPVSEILARYRTHSVSMLNSISNKRGNIELLCKEMTKLHPWLNLPTQ